VPAERPDVVDDSQFVPVASQQRLQVRERALGHLEAAPVAVVVFPQRVQQRVRLEAMPEQVGAADPEGVHPLDGPRAGDLHGL
jgi:hypothetical protein